MALRAVFTHLPWPVLCGHLATAMPEEEIGDLRMHVDVTRYAFPPVAPPVIGCDLLVDAQLADPFSDALPDFLPVRMAT